MDLIIFNLLSACIAAKCKLSFYAPNAGKVEISLTDINPFDETGSRIKVIKTIQLPECTDEKIMETVDQLINQMIITRKF